MAKHKKAAMPFGREKGMAPGKSKMPMKEAPKRMHGKRGS
jgi:hypothetical protein